VASPSPSSSNQAAPLPQVMKELWELIVEYFKQETVVPLQQLGRYVTFGLLGALLLGVGVLFLSTSALRALQTETGSTFTGNWSWAPYMIVTVAVVLGGTITWKTRGKRRNREVAR
jgi:hypothetical protein